MSEAQKEALPSAAAVLLCLEYLASMFIRGALELSDKYPAHAAYFGNPFIESQEFQTLLAAYNKDKEAKVHFKILLPFSCMSNPSSSKTTCA